MPRKESKFYVINLIDPRIIFSKRNFNTRVMKMHMQRSYKGGEWDRRIFVQGL